MFSVVIVCYAARAACSPFDGAAAMTEAHRQVCQEGQRHHIILLSPAAQRCRLAAFWKLQEAVDGCGGSLYPRVAREDTERRGWRPVEPDPLPPGYLVDQHRSSGD